MTLILSNAIVNAANADCIYVDSAGYMHVDVSAGTLLIENIPDNALQQVAVAIADGKRFLEMEDASLIIEGGNEDDTRPDIE